PAMQHGCERLALVLIGTLVDDSLHRAVSFINRPRPRIQNGKAQPVEHNVGEVALLDAARHEPTAIALGRTPFELARTAIIAVTTAERNSLYAPVNHRFRPRGKRAGK